MLEIKTINSELTIIGYFEKGKWLEITKHYDYQMDGTRKSFWRVDNSNYTISSLNRTKAEALKEARRWIKNNWRNN